MDLRQQSTPRAFVVILALLVDLFIIVAARGVPEIRQDALRVFAATNVALLGLDLALTLLVVRREGDGAEKALRVCVIIEELTAVVWIQMTGTLSSYFLATAMLLILLHRFFASHAVAMWALLSFLVFHAAAFGGEMAGLFPTASIFSAPSVNRWPLALSVAVELSILTSCLGVFAVANFAEWASSEKELALKAARENLARVLEAGHAGQLVGMHLAGKYHLTDSLGRGGMGEVYQATRTEDGVLVAVKVLHYHLGAADPATVARFRREVEAAPRVAGARVPKVLDSGTTGDGLHFIVMELLRGEDLGVLLRRRGRLPVEEVLSIADQLAGILDVTHAANVVHRDVKPSNVFLARAADGTEAVYLLDFGIAALQGPDGGTGLTRTATAVGTPGYLAPEQIDARRGAVGPATDVFAMSAVLYRALTGQPAFTPASASGAIYAALHQHAAPPSLLVPELPAEIDLVMQLALAKDPEKRYARASEFAADLRSAAQGTLPDRVRTRARAAEAEPQPAPTQPLQTARSEDPIPES